MTLEQAQRIAALRSRYQVQFEMQMSAATSLNNYDYLDILDRGFDELGLARPSPDVLCDVGCASFWYAATLAAFFRPRQLLGVDLEGHRLFRDGRTRIDYAAGYVARVPHARFVVGDYRRHAEPADLITAWFPFLSAPALLAWRLPLSLLDPAGLFGRIRRNLTPGGLFVMVNHGPAEAALAAEWCVAAGLERAGTDRGAAREPLACGAPRPLPARLSCWRLATASRPDAADIRINQ
jgi:SAM-dependent methyltransferase